MPRSEAGTKPVEGHMIASVLATRGGQVEEFDRNLASDADLILIDLEDSVAESEKGRAREVLSACFEKARAAAERPLVAVRLNELGSPDGIRDLCALLDATAFPDIVSIPKVESAGEMHVLAGALAERAPGVGLIPFIETIVGLQNIVEISRARGSLVAIGMGAADLASALGRELSPDALSHARNAVVEAAAARGIGAFDMPCYDLENADAAFGAALASRRFGFTGKFAFNAMQVNAISRAFAPSPQELAAARRVIEAVEQAGDGPAILDGRRIDPPTAAAARRTAAQAARKDRRSSTPETITNERRKP